MAITSNMADDRMKMCGCSGIRHCLLCETVAASMKNTIQKNDDVVCSLDPTEVDCYHFCLASSCITYGKWCNCVCYAKQEVIKNGMSNLKDDIEKTKAGCEKPELVYHRKLIERGLGSVEFKSLDGDSNESPLILDTTDVIVVEDFVTEREESYLQSEIYKLPWRLSQSGRRKQVLAVLQLLQIITNAGILNSWELEQMMGGLDKLIIEHG